MAEWLGISKFGALRQVTPRSSAIDIEQGRLWTTEDIGNRVRVGGVQGIEVVIGTSNLSNDRRNFNAFYDIYCCTTANTTGFVPTPRNVVPTP